MDYFANIKIEDKIESAVSSNTGGSIISFLTSSAFWTVIIIAIGAFAAWMAFKYFYSKEDKSPLVDDKRNLNMLQRQQLQIQPNQQQQIQTLPNQQQTSSNQQQQQQVPRKNENIIENGVQIKKYHYNEDEKK